MTGPELTPAEAVRCKFPREAAFFSDYLLVELTFMGNTKFAVRVENIELRLSLPHPVTGEESVAHVSHALGTIAIRASLKVPLLVEVDPDWVHAMYEGENSGTRSLVGSAQIVGLVVGKPFAPGTVVELTGTSASPKVLMRFASQPRRGAW